MIDTIQFFNGGDKFSQKFTYTKPGTNFAEENGTAYWQVNAPKRGTFDVPYEIQVGEDTHRLSVHKEVTQMYGERGVVRLEPRLKDKLVKNDESGVMELPELPEYQFMAVDLESAKAKGIALWKRYLRNLIDEFEAENMRRQTEKALPPRRPTDFVSHAYKELGLQVPGDEKYIAAGLQKTEIGELRETVAKQAEVIDKLIKRLDAGAPAVPDPAEAGQPDVDPVIASQSKEPQASSRAKR